jgi:hypothetical protein
VTPTGKTWLNVTIESNIIGLNDGQISVDERCFIYPYYSNLGITAI